MWLNAVNGEWQGGNHHHHPGCRWLVGCFYRKVVENKTQPPPHPHHLVVGSPSAHILSTGTSAWWIGKHAGVEHSEPPPPPRYGVSVELPIYREWVKEQSEKKDFLFPFTSPSVNTSNCPFWLWLLCEGTEPGGGFGGRFRVNLVIWIK